MAYQAWSVVFGEQPSASKWNILGTNDASFNDGSGFASGALGSVNASLANGMCVQQATTLSNAVATGTTLIPNDDTIPQITEGIEFMTISYTPKSAANILVIEALALLSSSVAPAVMSIALFQDATANALNAGAETFTTSALAPHMVNLRHRMVAGTTSAVTFRIRAGAHTAGTTTFNGFSGGRMFGAITKSTIVIREYKAT